MGDKFTTEQERYISELTSRMLPENEQFKFLNDVINRHMEFQKLRDERFSIKKVDLADLYLHNKLWYAGYELHPRKAK